MSDPWVNLGCLLTATEAGQLAARLGAGKTLTQALQAIAASRRLEVKAALLATGAVGASGGSLLAALRAIEGAAQRLGSTTPIWTMPGSHAGHGSLTSSLASLVLTARTSVTCATFNIQKSSALWDALGEVCQKGTVGVRLYLDRNATAASTYAATPTFAEIKAHMAGAKVFHTGQVEGQWVRSHAKFVAVDHRFLIVTSANQSASAELRNIELGLKVDSGPLTEMIENEMIAVESSLYEPVGGA